MSDGIEAWLRASTNIPETDVTDIVARLREQKIKTLDDVRNAHEIVFRSVTQNPQHLIHMLRAYRRLVKEAQARDAPQRPLSSHTAHEEVVIGIKRGTQDSDSDSDFEEVRQSQETRGPSINGRHAIQMHNKEKPASNFMAATIAHARMYRSSDDENDGHSQQQQETQETEMPPDENPVNVSAATLSDLDDFDETQVISLVSPSRKVNGEASTSGTQSPAKRLRTLELDSQKGRKEKVSPSRHTATASPRSSRDLWSSVLAEHEDFDNEDTWKPPQEGDYGVPYHPQSDVVLHINRSPVMILWTACVCSMLDYKWDEALSIAQCVATQIAEAKAKMLGIDRKVRGTGNKEQQRLKADQKQLHHFHIQGGTPTRVLNLMGREVLIFKSKGRWRAVQPGTLMEPTKPEQPHAYLMQTWGDRLYVFYKAMMDLLEVVPLQWMNEDNTTYHLYQDFRPEIPKGATGWGARGEISTKKILSFKKYFDRERAHVKSENRSVPAAPDAATAHKKKMAERASRENTMLAAPKYTKKSQEEISRLITDNLAGEDKGLGYGEILRKLSTTNSDDKAKIKETLNELQMDGVIFIHTGRYKLL
eukprot:Clim_evm1s209 gene=Clim_evmTU1s209